MFVDSDTIIAQELEKEKEKVVPLECLGLALPINVVRKETVRRTDVESDQSSRERQRSGVESVGNSSEPSNAAEGPGEGKF